MKNEIEVLNDAYQILDAVAGRLANGPRKPWEFVNDARNYVRQRMDEVAAPVYSQIFEDSANA